jgi:hypothetical protein
MTKKTWSDQHENILRQWGEAAACYRYMNHRAYLMYKTLSMQFTLPVIVLSTITGTANFAQNTFPEGMRSTVPSVIGGMNLVAGLIATIMQFLKINELMENHRAAALSYGLLSRNIRLMLALPREERKKDGLKFVEECKAEYDRLIEQSPAVPIRIIKEFEATYPDDETDFIKPEILDVRPIEVLTAITDDTPFASVGKMLNSRESSREGSIDVERGESRE